MNKLEYPPRLPITRSRIDNSRSQRVVKGFSKRKSYRDHAPPLVGIFLVLLFVPWIIQVGSTRLMPYRLLLLLMFIPCVFIWVSGRAGRIRTVDLLVLSYCGWCAISLGFNHGFETALVSGGLITIEAAGGYLFARCFIRSEVAFRGMVIVLFTILVVLFPLAVIEFVSGRNYALEVLSKILPTPEISTDTPRWGMRRVQSVLEHPILFGVCCSSVFSLTQLVLGDRGSAVLRYSRTGLVGVMVLFSLSSGPITAIIVQTSFLLWYRFTRNIKGRWTMLVGLLFLLYVTVALGSTQTVPGFLISRLAFDQQSGFYRLLIWEHGLASALNHPLFGVGNGRWDRPYWMPSSIDMFWLFHAIIYGIPAAIMIFLSFLFAVICIGTKKNLNEKLNRYRISYVTTMTSFFLVGWVVHFWGPSFVLFLFLLGSGMWILDARTDDAIPNNITGRVSRRIMSGAHQEAMRAAKRRSRPS